MKTAKLIKTALISGVTLAILNSCGGGGGNPLSWLLDKEWQGVETLESSSNDAYLGNLSVNSNGNIAIIWEQANSSGNSKIWLRKYNGVSWSIADNGMKPNNSSTKNPTVSIDDNNKIITTWLVDSGGSFVPKANVFDGSWLGINNIYHNVNNSSGTVMATNNQKTIAVWAQKVSSHYTIVGRVYNHTAHSWSPSVEISDSSYISIAPRVSIDSNNRAVIVWMQYVSGKYNIFAGVYNVNSGSVISAPHAIDTLPDSAWGPSVASDDSGNTIVVWKQKDLAGHYNIYARKYNGSWSSVVEIDNSDKPVGHPKIAFNKAANEFVAIWAQRNSDNKFVIHTNTYSSGSWQGVEVLETATEATDSDKPKIAFDSDGNAVAIWRKKNSSGKFDLVAKSYDGSDWGDTKVIDNLPESVDNAYIAFDGDDDAVVVWKQKDSSGHYSIFANYLE